MSLILVWPAWDVMTLWALLNLGCIDCETHSLLEVVVSIFRWLFIDIKTIIYCVGLMADENNANYWGDDDKPSKKKRQKCDESALRTATRLATIIATKAVPFLMSRRNQIHNLSFPKLFSEMFSQIYFSKKIISKTNYFFEYQYISYFTKFIQLTLLPLSFARNTIRKLLKDGTRRKSKTYPITIVLFVLECTLNSQV